MIVDINDNFIETNEIENITPIYNSYEPDGHFVCFRVYMKTNYINIKEPMGSDDLIKERRDKLVELFKNGKVVEKI